MQKIVKNNLHRMTWYSGTCRITAMGLLYRLTLWSKIYIFLFLDLDHVRNNHTPSRIG
jgi:hypothetical protein